MRRTDSLVLRCSWRFQRDEKGSGPGAWAHTGSGPMGDGFDGGVCWGTRGRARARQRQGVRMGCASEIGNPFWLPRIALSKCTKSYAMSTPNIGGL